MTVVRTLHFAWVYKASAETFTPAGGQTQRVNARDAATNYVQWLADVAGWYGLNTLASLSANNASKYGFQIALNGGTFRAAAQAGGATDSATVTKPTGTTDGDILVAYIVARRDTSRPNITPPDGWTLIGSFAGFTDQRHSFYWKRASSEGADYTFTQDGSGTLRTYGLIGAYSGCVATGDPVLASSNLSYSYWTFDTTLGGAKLSPILLGNPLDVPVAFGATNLETVADELTGTTLDVPVGFETATLETDLTATPVDVSVAFGSATVGSQGTLTAAAVDVPVVFGSAAFESHFLGTPLDVPIAFGAPALGALLQATELDVPIGFGAADMPWCLRAHDPLDVSVGFGGAQLRTVRSDGAVAYTEPLELRTNAGVLVRLLPLALKVRIRQAINSLDILSFEYPRVDTAFEDFQEGQLIRWRGQDYRIVDVNDGRETGGLSGSVVAEQWFISLGDTLVREVQLDMVTSAEAMATALSGTTWSVGVVQPPTRFSFFSRWKSPLGLLMQIADIWNGELEFDTATKTVHLLTERGVDLGASIIYRKNVVGLTRQRSAAELYNRIWFEGKDGLTSFPGYLEDADSIATYGRRDYFWSDASITNVYTLIIAARYRLRAYRNPRTTYEATAFNLEPLPGGASWIAAELGDAVKVYDEELGVDAALRVYGREWAPFEPDVPDRLRLSSDRQWFPDLGEKLAIVTDPTVDANPPPAPGEAACRGEGGYAWIDTAGVDPAWQGSGKPHIWTSYWSDGDAGLPHYGGDPDVVYYWYAEGQWHIGDDGKWHSGYDSDGDGVQDTGPLGVGETWETAEWEPHGFDLDCDGVEDFWPFGNPVGTNGQLRPQFGVPGGHCYNFDDQPEVWDWGEPYLAVDNIPPLVWTDVSAYDFYGWDYNGNGVPETWDDIADMPCPIRFNPGELLFGTDLGGGDIEWVAAPKSRWMHLWHSKTRADVQRIVLTGWEPYSGSWSDTPSKTFNGPIGFDDDDDGIIDRWDPPGYDTNDDGFVDFWPYSDVPYSFGYAYDAAADEVSDQPMQVAACSGGSSSFTGPVTPGAGGSGQCTGTTLEITISGSTFYTSAWEHGFDTDDEAVQFIATPRFYDATGLQLADISIERVDAYHVRVVGRVVGP